MELQKLDIQIELTDEDVDHVGALITSLAQQLAHSHNVPRDVAVVIATQQLITILKGFQEDEAKRSGIEIVEKEKQ